MAELEQVRKFIHRYAETENDVESLEKAIQLMKDDIRSRAELRLYRHGSQSPFFKYEVARNVATNYLSNQLSAQQDVLANMDSTLANLVVE